MDIHGNGARVDAQRTDHDLMAECALDDVIVDAIMPIDALGR